MVHRAENILNAMTVPDSHADRGRDNRIANPLHGPKCASGARP
jgi:hypothetical protein